MEFKEVKRQKSALDIIFEEKVIIYALLPFVISFSFFGAMVETVRILSKYDSPFFYWYPVYFIFILPFSIYTNSSMFAGSKFIRSILETLFEILLLILFNFMFLKGFSFERNIVYFFDINFGISVVFWIVMRLTNGHIVRLLNFPYEVLITTANSLSGNVKIDEIFDEKFFEKHSLRTTFRGVLATFIVMLTIMSIFIILSATNVLTIVYMFLFIASFLTLLVNTSKMYLLEDMFLKKINISSVSFMPVITRFSMRYVTVIMIASTLVTTLTFFIAREVSEQINSFIKSRVSEIAEAQRKVEEEEIRRIRERLMAETVTNEYTPRPVQPAPQQKIGWWIVPLVLQYFLLLLGVIIAIGFLLKNVFRVKDVPILSFFVKVYEIFAYFVQRVITGIYNLLVRLFTRRRRPIIPEGLEEELIKSMQVYKEEVSEEKMQEIETIVKIFINMLSYTSYILPYRRNMGVEEYCSALKNYLPEFLKNLEFISDIVNESRYSNHLLPPSSINELKENVEQIVSKIKVKVRMIEDYRGAI